MKKKIVKFIRESLANKEKGISNLDIVKETPLLDVLNQFLKYLLSE